MKDKKFYYVAYVAKHNGHEDTRGTIVDVHPLQFASDYGDPSIYGTVVLLSWQEITAAEYRRYNDEWA